MSYVNPKQHPDDGAKNEEFSYVGISLYPPEAPFEYSILTRARNGCTCSVCTGRLADSLGLLLEGIGLDSCGRRYDYSRMTAEFFLHRVVEDALLESVLIADLEDQIEISEPEERQTAFGWW